MEFRNATIDDYPIVANLFYQIFEKHLHARTDIYHDGNPLIKEVYEQFMVDENQFVLLCIIDEAAAGMCHYKLMDTPESSILNRRSIVYIEDFCVDKAFRRKGIGKALIQSVIEHAKQLKADAVELSVWALNKEAEAFYRSIGLQPRSTRMEYILP